MLHLRQKVEPTGRQTVCPAACRRERTRQREQAARQAWDPDWGHLGDGADEAAGGNGAMNRGAFLSASFWQS